MLENYFHTNSVLEIFLSFVELGETFLKVIIKKGNRECIGRLIFGNIILLTL